MSRIAVVVLLYWAGSACDASASASTPSVSCAGEPAGAASGAPKRSEVPSSATATPSNTPEPPAERRAPVRVAPRILAVSWPQYVGRRVSVVCRPSRRLDFTRTLVVADGARFVVSSSPNVTPCGADTSTFTVLGSTTVPLAGHAALPELLLEEGGEQLQ